VNLRHVLPLAVAIACGGNQSNSPTPDGPGSSLAPGPTLTASPGQGIAHLSWTAIDGASSYNVYRSGAKGDPGSMIQAATATQIDDTTIANFQPYWYTVTGVVGGVETAPSNQANAFGYDLTHWTPRHSAIPLYAMLFVPANVNGSGHDMYVATGEAGLVLTSQDGTTWRGSSTPITITALTYGNGLFVGVGDGAILTSPDGVTWTYVVTESAQLRAVTYVEYGSIVSPTNLFIAVGNGGNNDSIYTSPDGKTWTGRSCTGPDESFETASIVTSFKSLTTSFMAVIAGDGVACYSTNGSTWTSITGLPGQSFRTSVADPSTSSVWLGDHFAGYVDEVPYNFGTKALGTTSSAMLPLDTGSQLTGLTSYTDAASVRHIVAASTDGVLYDDAADAPDSGFTAIHPTYDQPLQSKLGVNGLASNGTSLFVLGAGQQLLRSDNGGGSLKVLHDDAGGISDVNQSVLAHDGTIVIDRGSGALWTSTDSATFTASATGASALPSAQLVDNGSGWGLFYIDPTSALELYESTDAQTWTHTMVPVTACPACMANHGAEATFDGSNYLVSMVEQENNQSEGVGVIGAAGTGFNSALQTPTSYFSQVWSKGGAYYGLTESSIMTSTDGFTWTTYATPMADGVAYYDDGTKQYIGSELGQVATSTDGINWSAPVQIDPGQRFVQGFIRLGDHVIVYGDDGLLAATNDGSNWTPIDTGTSGNYRSASVTDRGLVLSGNYDVVLTAP